MTREQLLALGFTEEQVNQIMQLHGTATQNLRNQVTNLTGQLEAVRGANPPANPPAPTDPPANPDNQELTNALNRIKELENENRRKDILAHATAKGLVGEEAEKILNAFGDNADLAKSAIDSISQIISDNRASAAQAKEQELARKAGNPGGGSGGGSGEEKSSAEKIASKLFGAEKKQGDILSHYVGGIK